MRIPDSMVIRASLTSGGAKLSTKQIRDLLDAACGGIEPKSGQSLFTIFTVKGVLDGTYIAKIIVENGNAHILMVVG